LYVSILSALTRKGHCCVISVCLVLWQGRAIVVHEYTWHFWKLLLSWSVMCVTTLHISMLYGLLVVKYTNKMLFQNLSGLFWYQSWPRNGQFVLFVCWSLQSENIFFCQFESCDRPLMNNNFFLLYEVPNSAWNGQSPNVTNILFRRPKAG
jgi:hypothetical protein